MYSSLRIQGYRGLSSFRMDGLGRVNLLVGTNNSGKTSILECLALLRSAGDPEFLASVLRLRGEYGHSRNDSGQSFPDPKHLFAHHSIRGVIDIYAECLVGSRARGWNDRVRIYVEEPGYEQLDYVDENEPYLIKVDNTTTEDGYKIKVTPEGLLRIPRLYPRSQGESEHPIQFVRTGGMTVRDIVRQFNDVVLTQHEIHVTDALRIIEPSLDRIAALGGGSRQSPGQGPGGVVLKLRDAAERIPIGSAGDGMWRMLGLALSIANAKGGVMLVDEIDTGLHYSIMEDMWRMISERASALSVQVFATTHSRDCYESLAAIVQPDTAQSGVTIQRIAPDRRSAVGFSNQDIMAAAERGIEVR